MASPSPITLQAFEREVRQGVNTWAREVFRATAQQLGNPALTNAVAVDRMHTAELLAVLQNTGRAEALAASMARAVDELMSEGGPAPERAAPAGSPGAPLTLTLIAEDQIDDDIAIARIIQSIESEAEWELRQLASLCSGLGQRPAVDADANPLGPTLCARALKRAVEGLALGKPARSMLMREAGAALGRQLRSVYAALNTSLERQGVRPAQYVMRQAVVAGTPTAVAAVLPKTETQIAASSRPAGQRKPSRAAPRSIASGELGRLLDRARSIAEKTAALERAVSAGAGLRLLAEPVAVGSAAEPASLDARTAVRVMDRLLDQLARQPALSDHARGLLQRLAGPARRIAAHEPQLWATPDHPWWQLLDRVLALGTIYEHTAPAPAGLSRASLADVVDRLVAGAVVDRKACEAALEDAEAVATTLLEERKEQLVTEVGAIQAQADRSEIEIGLRNQLLEQMRASPAAPGLRQFLLGAWTLAMAEVAQRQGIASPALAELGQQVEDLLRACARRGRAVSVAQQRVLLNKARAGLTSSGMPAARIEAELADLAKLLRDPPVVVEEAAPDAEDGQPPRAAPSTDLMGYAGMPTVPIDMVESMELTSAVRDRLNWLDGLVPGDACRMFLQGRWVTAQLTWIGGNRNLFVFASRHAGRTHSMTRRVLDRLRAAGLAATIEPGLLLAQALNTTLDTMLNEDEAGGR